MRHYGPDQDTCKVALIDYVSSAGHQGHKSWTLRRRRPQLLIEQLSSSLTSLFLQAREVPSGLVLSTLVLAPC